MRILAVIPARAGSKRLPGKNIRILGGKPLIVWSIDAAKNIPEICDILVSTDDAEIATVVREANVLVPWLRPMELATDTASSVDVVLHALDWYEAEHGVVDGVLLLQPTSPFRTQEKVKEGIALFEKNNRKPVLGVSPVHAHPLWTFKIKDNYLEPFIDASGLQTRSQDLPKAYTVNGGFYSISSDELRVNRSFFGAETIPLIFDNPKESLDIDTEWDWKLANYSLGNA